jgi:prepilin-type N-terminal cleavage/methylation domain-containing protein
VSARQRRGGSAFTLLEVMVAIAILAVSLTAIFSSEAGAIKMAHRARKMGMATLLPLHAHQDAERERDGIAQEQIGLGHVEHVSKI